MFTRRRTTSFKGLHSPLAQSPGEYLSCKAMVKSGSMGLEGKSTQQLRC